LLSQIAKIDRRLVGRTVSPVDFANVTDADSPTKFMVTESRNLAENFGIDATRLRARMSFIADFGILSAIKDESVGSLDLGRVPGPSSAQLLVFI